MTFTTPIFWYHQGPRAHQLPDARSDAKGRAVLRKIRAGYATISPQRTASSEPATAEILQEPTTTPTTQPESPIIEEQPAAPIVIDEQQLPPTPPEYESLDPPPYAQPLPPTLPGYTALPEVIAEPARDLKQQPSQAQRRRYRDVLRRRLKALRSEGSDSESDSLCVRDSESARGVVMYQGEDDCWARVDGLESVKGGDGEVLPRQRGVRAWLKRTWDRFLEWSEEHPYLFILAVFVIVVVVFCVLI